MAGSRFATVVENYINKMRMFSSDKFTLAKVTLCEKFIKRIRDKLILGGNKGNTTVAIG